MRYFLLLACLVSISTFAQKSRRVFYRDGLETDSLSSNSYRDFTDSGNDLGHFVECDSTRTRIAEGALVWRSNLPVFTGLYTRYYPNQQKAEEVVYQLGSFSGERKLFYPDGKPAEISVWQQKQKNEEYFQVLTCYDRDGKITVEKGNGFCTRYYPDGKPMESGRYVNGVRDSVWVGYASDGRKRYEERHARGKLKEGVGYDAAGKAYPYTQSETEAIFEGGMDGLLQHLAKTMRYPKQAQEDHAQGHVACRFIIEEDGSISRIVVLHTPHWALTREALRIIRGTTGKWQPATQYGLRRKSIFQMPVTFVMQ